MTPASERVALLFSGQGSQVPGMGVELASRCKGCRGTFAAADEALGYALSRIMAEGPVERLRRTAIAQPALLTLATAQARHLVAHGVRPAMGIGHSLGQYTALVVAGAIAFEDALRLVALRGELMQRTVPEGQGAMAAIVGLELADVAGACARASAMGVVGIACFNAPGQLVIAGAARAVDAAGACCEELGGTAIPLEVSAPFHSPLLAPMLAEFRAALAELPIRRPTFAVVDNVTGAPTWEPDDIRTSLARHLVQPVLFEHSLAYAAGQGIRRFLQCGPGGSLLSFAKRCVAGAVCASFDQTIAELGEGQTGEGAAHAA